MELKKKRVTFNKLELHSPDMIFDTIAASACKTKRTRSDLDNFQCIKTRTSKLYNNMLSRNTLKRVLNLPLLGTFKTYNYIHTDMRVLMFWTQEICAF